MNLTKIFLGVYFLSVGNLIGQTNQIKYPIIETLDPESQSNIIVIRNEEWPRPPCPPEFTNLISNTNLFTPAEEKLLLEIPLKYKDVTTNSGPPGSVLAGLKKDTNGLWTATFKYDNLEGQDQVTFVFGLRKTAMFLDKSGDGYGVTIGPADYRNGKVLKWDVALCQFKHGVRNGLVVRYYDDGHCTTWMQFSNGMAVGKWLEWDSGGGLSTEVQFKAPYDFDKHYHVPFIK